MMGLTKSQALFGGSLTIAFSVVLALVLYYSLRDNDEPVSDPVVTVAQGDLRGQWVDGPTGDGFKYAAFRWIPYAKPPLGPLRFKKPRPHPKWDGVRDATTEGQICFQMTNDLRLVGSEDCLILNVYTPQLPEADSNKTLLPVLFYIHGGSFISGSSSIDYYGPDFLVTQGIVVVTINYRLNAFGFLNFENDVVPGNTGLKDQIFALEWVQDNIAAFGGDPKKVTIQGQSAGAACVHWLTLLPQTEGLFRAAIIQSGSAIQGWGYMERNMVFAEKLVEVLADGRPTNLYDGALKLMEEDPVSLYMAAQTAYYEKGYNVPGDNVTAMMAPCPQRYPGTPLGEERLILRDSESYVLDRAVPDVPVLMGITSNEWLLFWYLYTDYTDPARDEVQIDDLVTFVPQSLIPREDTQRFLGIEKQAANYSYQDVAKQLKAKFFYPVDPTCDHACKLKQYENEIFIEVDMTRLARLRSLHSTEKTYLYRFAVKSDYNYDIPEETPEEKQTAAVHADDLYYLYRAESLHQNFTGEGLAPKTLRRMVKMWANFVKFLDPTPITDEDITVKWEPYDKTKPGVDTYLNIAEDLTMQQGNIGGDNIPFWLDVYKTYRDNLSI